MGKSPRMDIAQVDCRVSQQVGRWAGTHAFWLLGTRPRLVSAEPRRLQDLVVHDDCGDNFRGDRELRPPVHRSSPAQQHGSNTRVERLMARPRIPVVQQPIPFVSFRAHRRGICPLWRRFYSLIGGMAGGRYLPLQQLPCRGSISTFTIFQTSWWPPCWGW